MESLAMRTPSPQSRDSGIQRPASLPLPQFLRDMRKKAKLTQRELGAKLDRHAKFVYDSESALRRVELGEFIEWSLACGANPVSALLDYGKVLGSSWAVESAAPAKAAKGVGWSNAELNEGAPAYDASSDRDALLALLTACLSMLEPVARDQLVASLPEAQKPMLLRMMLERLADSGKARVSKGRRK